MQAQVSNQDEGRGDAIALAARYSESGYYFGVLRERVALATESQLEHRHGALRSYLEDLLVPAFCEMGFTTQLFANPVHGGGPLLLATRLESPRAPTLLAYGHADVVPGMQEEWQPGLDPWQLIAKEGRLYGRGTADNKGQHTIAMLALKAVIDTRGSLGFNAKFLIETSEEIGSTGLQRFCQQNRDLLAADILVASDGPRIAPHRPTLILGTRGALNIELRCRLREKKHHPGNWGGLISNPATVLCNAIASLISKDGQILVKEILPSTIPPSVRRALRSCDIVVGEDADAIEPGWGQPGLSPQEKVLGWTTLELLALSPGNPDQPVNAIPGEARAILQVRYTVDVDRERIAEAIQSHLQEQGFDTVEVICPIGIDMPATRLDPDHPVAQWAARSITNTLGEAPVIMPNAGGSLPNDCFANDIGMATIWVPHSYAGCQQHAPNEHLLECIVSEGLQIMTGLYWDLGAPDASPIMLQAQREVLSG